MGLATIEPDAMKRLGDPEIRRFLDEKWSLIEEKFAPEHFILFGSRVNGTPHEWSDIDAIIVSNTFSNTDVIGRSYRFKTIVRPHIPMSTLCYSSEEFADMRTGIGVVPDACREGVWIK